MKRCKVTKELLNLYSAEKEDERKSALASEHLKTCPECARQLLAITMVDETIEKQRHTPEVEAPPGLRTRILANVEALKDKHRKFCLFKNYIRYVGLAGVAAVVIITTIHFGTLKNEKNGDYTSDSFVAQTIQLAKISHDSGVLSEKTSKFLNDGGMQ